LYGAGTAPNYLGGNLGIGTTNTGTSSRKLSLSSTASTYMQFINTLGRTVAIGNDTVGSFIVYDDTAANYRLVVSNGGNLLLGSTTDAGFKLDVNGTARVSGTITINTSGQSATFSTFYGSGSQGQNIFIGGGGLNSGTGGGSTVFGSYNTSVGVSALLANTTGHLNTAIGTGSLASNTTGNNNNANGNSSLTSNTTGINNTGIGVSSLFSNTTGNNNTSLGFQAGYGAAGVNTNTTGTNNIFIGYISVGESSTESNRTWIGNTSTASTWLGGNLLVGTRTNGASFINVGAGTTAKSQINLASSTAPTSPVNGDIWFDGTDLKMRIGGVTKTFTLV
jgi:hypothetical protein